jgi:hypothetical protein
MADAPPPETLYYVPSSDSGSPDGPWSWIAEVAVIACGFVWSPQGNPIDSSVLGGPRFNDEEGRGPFHDRDHQITGSCLAVSGLSHKDILLRLQRENDKRGWDHTTKLSLSCSDATTASGRALLWNALYAGSHVILTEPELPSRFQTFFSKNKPIPASLDNWGDFWIPNQDLG